MWLKEVLDKIYHMKFLNEIEITDLLDNDTFEDSKEWHKDSWKRDWQLKEKQIKRDDFDTIITLLIE